MAWSPLSALIEEALLLILCPFFRVFWFWSAKARQGGVGQAYHIISALAYRRGQSNSVRPG